MLQLNDTGLEEFSFGDADDDRFILLVNKTISPEGIDFEKLRLTDPRKFDSVLERMGCILMLNGEEIRELERRGEIDTNHLHASLFELAKQEGLL
ncbi:MAG: hypothetical protein AAFW89_14485 [Bacteroidota bacterium]